MASKTRSVNRNLVKEQNKLLNILVLLQFDLILSEL